MAACYGTECPGDGLPCIWCDAPAASMSDLATPAYDPPGHDPLCGQHCDGRPPKCRGGDCTLCDEADCSCDHIALVRAHQHHATRQRVLTALLDARDREPHALWSLAKVIELVDEATR